MSYFFNCDDNKRTEDCDENDDDDADYDTVDYDDYANENDVNDDKADHDLDVMLRPEMITNMIIKRY